MVFCDCRAFSFYIVRYMCVYMFIFLCCFLFFSSYDLKKKIKSNTEKQTG